MKKFFKFLSIVICILFILINMKSLLYRQLVITNSRGFSVTIQTRYNSPPFTYLNYYCRDDLDWKPIWQQNTENGWAQGFWSKDGTLFIVATDATGKIYEIAYDFTDNRTYYDDKDIESLVLKRGGNGKRIFSGPADLDGKSSYPWFWDILEEPEHY